MTVNYLKEPDQQIYDKIYNRLLDNGIEVYDFLPDLDAKYPFVVMGETQLLPQATKSFLIGRVTISLHIWQNNGDRRSVTEMIGSIRRELSKIEEIDGRAFIFDRQSTSQIFVDNSTDETLLHGVMDLEFKFI